MELPHIAGESLKQTHWWKRGHVHEYSCLRSAEALDPTSSGVTNGCKAPMQVRANKLVSSAVVAYTLPMELSFQSLGHPFKNFLGFIFGRVID